ncbi:hypothetical protein [Deinococcus kurensis]|uniref:hypothetical protein n=1 Tax=Deinococcus kurensis TaxID=2662757 RepID=UPI0012D2EC2A|nr:hypothetical protein [Deinococcus kurensis]
MSPPRVPFPDGSRVRPAPDAGGWVPGLGPAALILEQNAGDTPLRGPYVTLAPEVRSFLNLNDYGAARRVHWLSGAPEAELRAWLADWLATTRKAYQSWVMLEVSFLWVREFTVEQPGLDLFRLDGPERSTSAPPWPAGGGWR